MQITTNTTTVYTIELSDADVGEILADPSDFVRQLRELRQGHSKDRARGLGRKIVDYPKALAASGRKPIAKTPCPKCGRQLSPQGMVRHVPTCTGVEGKA